MVHFQNTLAILEDLLYRIRDSVIHRKIVLKLFQGGIIPMKKMMSIVVVALFFLAVYSPGLSAQEKNYELKSVSSTVKDILLENIGRRVIVRLDTGDNLEGTVNKVGDNLVHLSKISGRDFYDAAVRIDKISAVIFKVRGN